jgi:hypothetical protein
VITADILLAARLVGYGVAVLNPCGEAYSAENIQERLTLRNLKELPLYPGFFQNPY